MVVALVLWLAAALSVLLYLIVRRMRFTQAFHFPGPRAWPLLGNCHLLLGTQSGPVDVRRLVHKANRFAGASFRSCSGWQPSLFVNHISSWEHLSTFGAPGMRPSTLHEYAAVFLSRTFLWRGSCLKHERVGNNLDLEFLSKPWCKHDVPKLDETCQCVEVSVLSTPCIAWYDGNQDRFDFRRAVPPAAVPSCKCVDQSRATC
ncbi:hypothetical protein J6590_014360 [Homalodisca vitripennis]|nr:hypothetical protein J6590_014360 [Homalodisca vitripennis]